MSGGVTMAIQILGTYPSEQEAITSVEVHALAGLREDNITLFANTENAKSLENHTQVTVKANQPMEDEADSSWMDKIKDMFSNDEDFDLHSEEQLRDFGLTSDEASKCLEAVEAGKIVVFADDEIRMGHSEDVISN